MYSLSAKRSVRRAEPQAFTLIELPAVRKSKRRAFTLIELLVVVAIIALLVAILLPSLNEARAIAEQAVCGSNTHQWALAYVLYDSDNGSLPCYVSDSLESSMSYSMGPYLGYNYDDYTWGIHFQDLSTTPPMWQCPSEPDWSIAYRTNYPQIIAYTNQAYRSWPWARKPFSIDQFYRPAQTIVMGDGHRLGGLFAPYGLPTYAPYWTHWRPDMDWDGDGVDDTNTQLYDWSIAYAGGAIHYNGIAARHGDRMANMVFLDGHAEPWFINDLMEENRRIWGEDIWE